MRKTIVALLFLSAIIFSAAVFGNAKLARAVTPVNPDDKPAPLYSLVLPSAFTDITTSNVTEVYLIKQGIIKGNPDGTVAAAKALNRAEALTIFARLFKLEPAYDPKCTFPDVPKTAWFAGYVSAMCKTDLVSGYPDGTFRPEGPLNRAEALAILVRGLQELQQKDTAPKVISRPSDIPTQSWYTAYADYALERNLVPLSGDAFNAGKPYTRGDLFSNLYRLMRADEMSEQTYKTEFDPTVIVPETLARFSSAEEFDRYIVALDAAQPKYEYDLLIPSMMMEEPTGAEEGSAPTAAEPSEKSADESITNTQEAGVDEGGIVKAYGEFLVVLRRGQLFTVRLGDEELKPISRVAAYPEGLNSDAWYDEMLINENTVIVVGYSYTFSATEIELFEIDAEGNLAYQATYFLESSDYYSSRNYASRLTGNTFIFYMPHDIFWREHSLPTLRRWENGTLGDPQDILPKTKIYKPIQDDTESLEDFSTLHTVTRCDISGSPTITCKASGILGPYSRSFYVSPEHIYVWVSQPKLYAAGSEARAFVYQINIADGAVHALETHGQPIDQFSFKEDDTHVTVVVRDDSWGDGMWNPEFSTGQLSLARIPRNFFFLDDLTALAEENYETLPKLEGYNIVNRFAGDHLLFGESSGWWNETAEHSIYVKAYKEKTEAKKLELTHSPDRIEVMGDGAVTIGQDDADLKLTSIQLPDSVMTKDVYRIAGTQQGEMRSHGFFFKPDDTGGMLGLPIRTQGEFYSSLFDESSEVLFLDVNTSKEFSHLGTLASKSENLDDDCEVSCVDWYGNSRPIFYRGRVFALLGYELVEGKIEGGALNEVRRIDFLK